jgi:protein-tyrosine phosphatase
MAPFGVDLADHRSIQVTLDDLSLADVVVTMTRQHLRELVLQLPDVWVRAFTLPELVRRGEAAGPRQAGQTIAEWFGDVHRGRRRQDMVGTERHDDVSDPYGGPDAGYQRMAVELADLMDRLAILLWQAGPIDPSEAYRLPSPP